MTSGTGRDNDQWVRPLGTAEEGEFQVAVTPTATNPVSGWQHTSLRVAWVAEGGHVEHDTAGEEIVVVPLSGSFTVEVAGSDDLHLAGRVDVFAGPSDVAYVPSGQRITVRLNGAGPGRVALCGARSTSSRPPVVIPAADVPVEMRGSGMASREVRNFGVPGVMDAESIIACEVLTPAGNWSSYPPHKHDEERQGVETELEEIYYFQTRSRSPRASGPEDADAVGYQRVYGTGERPIDVLAEVRTGDVVLVPHGWHGPAMAPPSADLYYLNVMAGPGPAARLADLRRPGARVGPRHLGRPEHRPPTSLRRRRRAS